MMTRPVTRSVTRSVTKLIPFVSGGSSFNPESIASLALWTETKTGYIFSDTAMTTSAVLGGKIAAKKTLKVGLPNRIQSDTNKQPTYNASGCKHTTNTILTGDPISLTGAFTCYWTGTAGKNSAGSSQVIGGIYPATRVATQTFFGPQNSTICYLENDAGGVITGFASQVKVWPGYFVGRIRRDAVNDVYYKGRGSAGEILIGNRSGTLTIDSEGFVLAFSSCDVCLNDTLIFTADLPTTDAASDAAILSYLSAKDSAYAFGASTISRKMIVEGDSISSGSNTPNTDWGWNNQVLHQLTYGYRPTVYATGGATMAGIKTAADYATYGPTLGANDVVTLWAGTNDSFSAQALTDLLNWVTGCKAAIGSARLLVATGLPRVSVSDSARTTFNRGIRDNAVSKGYTVVDCGSDSLMGQAGQYADTTYYYDGIHPNINGHARLVSQYWLPAIQVLN